MDDTYIGAVALAVVLAAVYLALVRALDPNEREPLWAIAVVFMSGLVVAALAYLTVPVSTLELSVLGESVSKTIALAVAVGLGLGLVSATGRGRGWSEVNGPLDGIVYGASAGFGTATAYSLANEIAMGDAMAAFGGYGGGAWASFWPVALVGLAEGVFGAVIGAAVGAAVGRRGGRAAGLVAGGVAVSLVLRLGHDFLASPTIGSGSIALRSTLGLVVPAVLIAAVVVVSLRRERAAIATQLDEEVAYGIVTPDELATLRRYAARRAATTRRLLSGDLDGWMDLKSLQGRQVQLAMAKQRYVNAKDDAEREPVLLEIQGLRQSVQWIRQENPSLAGQGGSR